MLLNEEKVMATDMVTATDMVMVMDIMMKINYKENHFLDFLARKNQRHITRSLIRISLWSSCDLEH